MLARRALLFCVSLLIIVVSASFAFTQSAPPAQDSDSQRAPFVIPRSPIPADPLELATGATKILDTPEERATMLGLLERARQNSDLWGPTKPYVLKLSYNSSGNALYTGSGQMTQIWMSPARFRFDAQLGGFTQTRLFTGGRAYDQRSNSFVPLRLQMVRNVVFWPMNFAPRAMLRIAAGKLGETDLLCGLFSSNLNSPEALSAVPGRRWVEVEYCVEPKSGLLRVYSEAPGIYAVYDYSEPLEHNGHVLPRNISVTEAGQNVLNVHLETIADPSENDIATLTPGAALASAAFGNPLSFPIRFQQLAPAPSEYKGEVHPVIIHAILDSDGRALDQEPLQTADPVLTLAAMDLVRTRAFPPATGTGGNQRIVRAQREVFINVKFLARVQTASGQVSAQK